MTLLAYLHTCISLAVAKAMATFVVRDVSREIERCCHLRHFELRVVEHAAMLDEHAHIGTCAQAAAHLDEASRADLCEQKRVGEVLIVLAAISRAVIPARVAAFPTAG